MIDLTFIGGARRIREQLQESSYDIDDDRLLSNVRRSGPSVLPARSVRSAARRPPAIPFTRLTQFCRPASGPGDER